MHRRLFPLGLLPFALALLGAAPELTPEDLVRQGNAAFAREDFELAVKLYTQAEERITNPGLVASNKGAALCRLGDFDAAARHYEAALSDATAGRRAALLFNLGNCRLQQSRGSDAKRLQEAVDCYSLCMRQNGVEEPLKTDARHNLELAKMLWLRARLSKAGKDGGNQEEPKDKPEPKKEPDDKKIDKGKGPNGDPTTDPMEVPKVEPDPHSKERNPMNGDGTPPPGKGNLPPIPDTKKRVRMAPEDAAEHLERAAERILRERREHQRRSSPMPSRQLPDW